ncbi:hypothetical protein EXIGLDRAFT_722551 [Exidia glandulosa HHB12029]|uniref:Ribosomal RNA methyltransferase FtsJ domain-containing protein n=1 Tax=Exidia glandulosa HHB12029 TaxID=1314781 RepID=A0A165F8R7_EXIGL|nr:hypothetical protein EXIGLDRAFT_722551 [Exidia glandulosa HHB12029]
MTKDFRRLQQLKSQDRKRPLFDSHLRNQQKSADEATPEVEAAWFRNMKWVMSELDWATNGTVLPLSGNGPFRFLDLGCCPGGFSSYILGKNDAAQGVGISLPDGHNFLLEPEYRQRYTLILEDLLRYRLSMAPWSSSTSLVDLPLELSSAFDLVILDGHPLRKQQERASRVGPRLLVAQLIIGLQSVRLGGSLVVKLANAKASDTQRVIYLLDALSQRLTLCKPVSMHATRDTFYAVAQGLQIGGMCGNCRTEVRLDVVLASLQHGYALLSSAGVSSRQSALWDNICSQQEMKKYAKRLDELTAPVIRVQCDALEGMLREEVRDSSSPVAS